MIFHDLRRAVVQEFEETVLCVPPCEEVQHVPKTARISHDL